MFAYCNNNPINKVDYAGERPATYSGVSICGTAIPLPIPIPIPLPIPLPFAEYLDEIAGDIKAWVESQKGIKEYRDNSVYVLKDPSDNNLVKYIGRTNDPIRRQYEHKNDLSHPWRRNYEMVVLITGLTKNEAMMWEQFLISAYTVGYLENARREIAIKNIPKFQSYVYAVTEIYTGIPGSELFGFISRR